MIICNTAVKPGFTIKAVRMAAAGQLLLSRLADAGCSSRLGSRQAGTYIRSQGAVPIFKGYYQNPARTCASVNEELVHGIPGLRMLTDYGLRDLIR